MPQKQRSACRGAKTTYIIINQRIESKTANSVSEGKRLPSSAITLALTAESTMNKGIEREM